MVQPTRPLQPIQPIHRFDNPEESPQADLQVRSQELDAITAVSSDLRAIGAEPPEDQAADEIREVQEVVSVPPNTTKKTTPQKIISRRQKQSQRAFLDMC